MFSGALAELRDAEFRITFRAEQGASRRHSLEEGA